MPGQRSTAPFARGLNITSWALYDFANTAFYAVVVTRYLPLHVMELTGGKHYFINFGFYPAMIAAAFLAPWLGGSVGRIGFSKRCVIGLTCLCVLFTTLMTMARDPWALVGLFALAQVSYQLALVPYNNLLPTLASRQRLGTVSGIGVGLGYLGVVVSLPIAQKMMDSYPGYGTAYLTAACLFLLFSLPLFLIVPEKQSEGGRVQMPRLADFTRLLREPRRRWFIIGNFLCADALNAIFVFMVVFFKNDLGFGTQAITRTIIWLNIAALAGGIAWGPLTDRITPRRAMITAALFLGAAIGIAEFFRSEGLTFWSMILLGGPGVAGLWVAGRKWVVQLAPPGEMGSLFGLYGMTNKLSLVNAVIFALLADLTGEYVWSVLVILLSLVVGAGILWRVREP